MSRLEELTSRFEAADAADAAAAGNASTQNAADAGTNAAAAAPENAGDAGSQEVSGDGAGDKDAADATPAAATPAAAAPPAPAADEAPAWFSKALQREQIERANVTKEIKALQERIDARGGTATAAETKQLQNAATNLEQSNQRFAKIKATLGKDFDAFEKSGEVFTDLTSALEEQAAVVAAQAAELKLLRDRLDAGDARTQAQTQAEKYWQTFAADNPGVDGQALWTESLAEAGARGLKGDAAAGAAEILWQFKVDAAKAAKPAPQPSTGSPAEKPATPKTPTAPARAAPVTPGAARVVQTGAGARTSAAAKSPEKQIEDGDVDFGFAGRYGRFG